MVNCTKLEAFHGVPCLLFPPFTVRNVIKSFLHAQLSQITVKEYFTRFKILLTYQIFHFFSLKSILKMDLKD